MTKYETILNDKRERERERCEEVGNLHLKGRHELVNRVYSIDALAPTMRTCEGGMTQPKIEEESMKLRIRKLTEGECMRLMGFEKKDTDAMRQAGLSRANIYHTAGDGLITTIIAGIVGSLFNLEYTKCIEQYCDKLHSEVKDEEKI